MDFRKRGLKMAFKLICDRGTGGSRDRGSNHLRGRIGLHSEIFG